MKGPALCAEGRDFPANLALTLSFCSKHSRQAWKARVSAYEELVRIFSRTASDSDPAFRLYTRNPDLVKAMVTDSNAVAQEKGVDAARAFVEFGGKSAGK